MGIILITVQMAVKLDEIPEEELDLEEEPEAVLSQWANEIKNELETDPEFGHYVKVSVKVEKEEARGPYTFPPPDPSCIDPTD